MEKQYLRIYKNLREKIVCGAYPYNKKIPSKRNTAIEFGVSIITVEHAYDLLIEEGYITSRERSGYFVCYREGDTFGSPIVINCSSIIKSEPSSSTFPFSSYAKAARKVLADYDVEIFKKSENQGLKVLREAICEYLRRSRDIKVELDQIIVGSGSEYLYNLIIQLLGREVIYGIESPSYEQIAKVYYANGASYELLPLGNDGINSEALRLCLSNVLHITPYRSFPTGISATASKKAEYIRFAEERNGYIIEDDVESEFSKLRKPEETVFSLDNNKRVIYINSFSLTISSGVRIAYMIIPKMLKHKTDSISFYSCTVPTFEQLILAEILNNGEFERHLNRKRREIRKESGGSLY